MKAANMTPASEPEASCLDTRDRGRYWIIWGAGDTVVTFIPGERTGGDTSQQQQYTLHNQAFKTISTSYNGKYIQFEYKVTTWTCTVWDEPHDMTVFMLWCKVSRGSWQGFHCHAKVFQLFVTHTVSCPHKLSFTARVMPGLHALGCNNIISAEKNVKFLIYCSMALCLQTLSCAAGVESWQPAAYSEGRTGSINCSQHSFSP